MFKVLTVIGARPQIIKAAAVSRAIATKYPDSLQEIILHSGQHYDQNMSDVFFKELGIPKPDYNLNVGSGNHGKQTAAMIDGMEKILLDEKPDAVIVYGDTNSTLAAAVAASKIHIPLVHIEAGLRSFSKKMPEEVNRILCDHVSTLLFSPTGRGLQNLVNEGFRQDNNGPYNMDNPKIYHCGDVMYDNSMHFASVADQNTTIISDLGLAGKEYILSTIHRNNNTDEPERLSSIFQAFKEITENTDVPIILPLHPRTAKLLERNLLGDLYEYVSSSELIKIIPPASFLDMIALEKNASIVLTDSGGVQKESFFFEKPCIILRPETEWVELVENGNAVVVDADKDKIISAYKTFRGSNSLTYPSLYGDGKAAEFICGEILAHL